MLLITKLDPSYSILEITEYFKLQDILTVPHYKTAPLSPCLLSSIIITLTYHHNSPQPDTKMCFLTDNKAF